MGAISAVVLGLCSPGDHIVAQRQLYAGTQLLLQTACPRFGIDVTFVDGTEPGALRRRGAAGRDHAGLRRDAGQPPPRSGRPRRAGRHRGPITVVDSTFATPLAQRPLDHGVDLVIHSATKAIAGHNDATLGVVAGSDELCSGSGASPCSRGRTPSPFDAMNGLRGLRTLGVRLRQQTETAQRLAEVLDAHPAAEAVRYPGLDSHPQHDLAKRQMRPDRRPAHLRPGRRARGGRPLRRVDPGGSAGHLARRARDAGHPPGLDHPREPLARASSRPTASARERCACRSASSTPTTWWPTSCRRSTTR